MAQSEAMTYRRDPERRRQLLLLELRRRWQAHEPPPSYREMAEFLGMSRAGVQHHARALQQDGLLHPGILWLTPLGYRATEGDDFGEILI